MPLPVFGAAGTHLSGSSSTTAAIPVPAGVTAGQIVLVHLYKENTAAVTPPAGFTELTPAPSTTSSVHTGHVFWKRATGSDSGTYSFSWTGSVYREGVAERYTGCASTGSPVDVYDSAQRSTAGTVTPAVSVTTTGADRLLVWSGTNFNSGAWTPPSGFTERYDGSDCVTVATKDQATAGSSGSVTGTCASSATETAFLLALLPDVTDVTVTDPTAGQTTAGSPDGESIVALTNTVVLDDVDPAATVVADPGGEQVGVALTADLLAAQAAAAGVPGGDVAAATGDHTPAGVALAGAGGESVLVEEPGLPAGGAPHVTLWLVDRTTGALSPLPHPLRTALSPVRNSPGAFSFEYPAHGAGFETLRSEVQDQRRRVEVEMWVGGRRFNALRGYVLQAAGDDVAEDSTWEFAGHFLEWEMSDARLAHDPGDEKGEVRFSAATAGVIMRTLMQQAQARGTLTGVDFSSFSNTLDSAGVAWAKNVTIKFTPYKSTYLTVLDKLVALGLCEWEITVDHELKVFNPGGRGRDLTTYSPPVQLRRAVSLMESQRRVDLRDVGTDLYGTGGEGLFASAVDASARARIGTQIERDVDSNNIEQQAALTAFVQNTLPTVTEPVVEITHGLVFGTNQPAPVSGFRIGDWLYSDVGRGLERVRVVQWVLSQDVGGVDGSVTLNDTIGDRVSRLQRRLDAMQDGSAVVGTSTASTIDDVTPPAAPTGLVADSIAYQDDAAGETYASVTVGWDPVTTDADGSANPLVQAAQLILARMQTADPIFEDWTWEGAPQIVYDYNDPLLDEWDNVGDPEVWLQDYINTHDGVPTATDDVAGYRVRYAYVGLNQVGGIPSSDPFPDYNLNYYEATDNQGTTATSFTFGGVGAGASIRVQVAAFDRAGNQSAWSTPLTFDTEVDNTPPPVPAAPTVAVWFRTVDVTSNGLGSSSEAMPLDWDHNEVWLAQSATFTGLPATASDPGVFNPATATPQHVANLYGAGTWNQPDIPVGVGWYAALRSVDRARNVSAVSAVAGPATAEQLVSQDLLDSIITAPKIADFAVESAKIVDAAIVRAKIGDLAVNSAKVEDIQAGLITTGTLTATVTNSGMIRTASTGNRLEFDSAGIRLYQGSGAGTLVGRWNTTDGSMLVTGTYQSGLTGERINILPDGTLRFYPAAGANYSQIANFGNDLVMRGVMDGSGRSGRVNANALGVGMNFSAESEIPSDLRSEMVVFDRRARITAPLIDFEVNGKLTPPDGSFRRITFSQTNSSGVRLASSVLEYKLDPSSNPGMVGISEDAGWKAEASSMLVVNAAMTSFVASKASAFVVSSTGEGKDDVQDVRALLDPWETIRAARARRYIREADKWYTPPPTPENPDPQPVPVADPPVSIGVIAEELPAALQVLSPAADGSGPELSVDLAKQYAVLWGAINQLQDQRVVHTSAAVTPPPLSVIDTDFDVTVAWAGGVTQSLPALVSIVPVGPGPLQQRAITATVAAITTTGVTVRFRTKRALTGLSALDPDDRYVVNAVYSFIPPYVPPEVP